MTTTSLHGAVAFAWLPFDPTDGCTVPAAGAPEAIYWASAGLVDLSLTSDYEAATQSTLKNASGNACASFSTAASPKGTAQLSGTLCSLCPDLIASAVGATLLVDAGGDTVGFSSPSVGTQGVRGTFIVWARAVSGGTAGTCAPTGQNYWVTVMPSVSLVTANDFTWGDAFAPVPVSGIVVPNANVTAATLNAVVPGLYTGVTALNPTAPVHTFQSTVLPTLNADSCAALTY